MDKHHYYKDDGYEIDVDKEEEEYRIFETSKQIDEQVDDFFDKAKKLWNRVMKPYLKESISGQPMDFLEHSIHGTSVYKFINYITHNNKAIKDMFDGKYVNLHN